MTYGKDVPKLPEYKNVLDLTADDITELMAGMGVLPETDDSYDGLEAPDEETVRYYLDNYELLGCENVEEAIEILRNLYGEDLYIPEEYLNN